MACEDEQCSECGHTIIDDYILESQPVSDYRDEQIPVGYRCSNCGNVEWY